MLGLPIIKVPRRLKPIYIGIAVPYELQQWESLSQPKMVIRLYFATGSCSFLLPALSHSLSLSLFGLTLAVHSGIFSRTSCGIVVWLLPFDCAHNKNWHIFLVSMRLLLLCIVFTFHNCRAQWKFTKKTTRNPKTNGENSK